MERRWLNDRMAVRAGGTLVLMDGAKGSVTSNAIGGTVAAGDLLFATP